MKQKSSFETMIQTLLKHLAFVGIYYLLQDEVELIQLLFRF